jgi:hypothetical protein
MLYALPSGAQMRVRQWQEPGTIASFSRLLGSASASSTELEPDDMLRVLCSVESTHESLSSPLSLVLRDTTLLASCLPPLAHSFLLHVLCKLPSAVSGPHSLVVLSMRSPRGVHLPTSTRLRCRVLRILLQSPMSAVICVAPLSPWRIHTVLDCPALSVWSLRSEAVPREKETELETKDNEETPSRDGIKMRAAQKRAQEAPVKPGGCLCVVLSVKVDAE